MRMVAWSCVVIWATSTSFGCGEDAATTGTGVRATEPSSSQTTQTDDGGGNRGLPTVGGATAVDASLGDASGEPVIVGEARTPQTCETKVIDAHGLVPDMLILQDRSLSMLVGRWDPSKEAVKSIS